LWGYPRLAKIDGVDAGNIFFSCRHFSLSTYIYVRPAP
jgi:hypothetical protein